MKTKIVYVVSSNKDDWYLDQTLLSVYSLRKYNLTATVVLVVDNDTDSTIQGKRSEILKFVNEKIVVPVPERYSQIKKSRFIKTSLREYIEGDFLFIDSDTIITDDLSDIDGFEGDIGMVLNVHVPLELQHDKKTTIRRIRQIGQIDDIEKYYNSGVIYVKDSEVGHLFYKSWHQKWLETLERCNFHYDQPSLAVVNAELSFPVKELDGIWNCQVMNNGLPFLYRAKIIHYFANHAVSRKNVDKAYLLHNKDIYLEIKDKGCVSDAISILIDNAKGAFPKPCRPVVGNELLLITNSLAYFSFNHPHIYNAINIVAKVYNKTEKLLKMVNIWNKR